MKQTTWLAATGAAFAIGIALVGVTVASSPSPLPDPSAGRTEEPTNPPAAETVEPSLVAEPSVAVPYPAPTTAATPDPAKTPATPQPAKTTEESPDVEPATIKLSGVLKVVTDADGDPDYAIGTTRLSVGPPWFWGTNHPFTGLVGETITVTGHMDDGTGPKKDKANGTTKVRAPEFEVYTVNGATVREPGKPDWAGGPKRVGSTHPGYAGWSKNHPKETPTP